MASLFSGLRRSVCLAARGSREVSHAEPRAGAVHDETRVEYDDDDDDSDAEVDYADASDIISEDLAEHPIVEQYDDEFVVVDADDAEVALRRGVRDPVDRPASRVRNGRTRDMEPASAINRS